MRNFPRKLITEWRRLSLPIDDGVVVVACSGGADSTALLLAINELVERKKLGHKLIAAHFDHGLRKDSETDAEFVRELCKGLNVEFILGRSAVAKRGNLEENARKARYKFLASVAEKHRAFAMLTGHTINDQAETFLLNLVRGSGPDGLAAMPLARPLADSEAQLVRPLLKIAKREDTVEYCRENGVGFRTDPMNDDLRFSRVRMRREVIPLLAELNPRIVETLARTAEYFSQLPKAASAAEKLRSSELLDLDESARVATIREWLIARRGHAKQLTSAHINAVSKLVKSTKSGRISQLPGGAAVERKDGWLTFRAK
ncbi:MAG: tRNA lysidine(34) synthetase TilS [Acidobacteria bacterium]|nr:tRNA lysidine(34) synthetase TilS [Acidobacteriota bacterium]